MNEDFLKGYESAESNNILLDSEISSALSTILRISASLVKYDISPFIEDWNLPKSTPIKVKRKIIEEAEKINEINRLRAIDLKSSWNILNSHLRNNLK